MYLGKARGFGQRFDPPEPTPYLAKLLPFCSDYQRSNVTLKLIREDIKENRLNEFSERPNDYLLDEAIRRTTRAFLLPKRVPLLHLNDVFKQDLPIWSSSPGLPWNQCGYKTKDDIRKDPVAVQRVRYFWHMVKTGRRICLPDSCAYVRAHICRTGESKVRAVWGYPATVTFGEAVFALPLIRAYQKHRTPLAYGFETGAGGMKKIYHSFGGSYFLGIDFKKFDKSLPRWLIKVAFDILAYNLDFTKYEDYGVPVVDGILRMWHTLKNYCINTRIRMCNGERYMKRSGLASGSYFTQLVGSICNHILLTYAALKCDVEIANILVFGDDSILSTISPLTPDDVQNVLDKLGMTVNVAKSGYSRYISNLSFLGYKINAGYPLKDRDKSFASLVWPERRDYCWDDVASRALGILYSNLGVDEVVDFWCRRIVKFRPFDIHLTRDQERFLAMLKIPVDPDPPSVYDFFYRLNG